MLCRASVQPSPDRKVPKKALVQKKPRAALALGSLPLPRPENLCCKQMTEVFPSFAQEVQSFRKARKKKKQSTPMPAVIKKST
jgi:hypothetical protein